MESCFSDVASVKYSSYVLGLVYYMYTSYRANVTLPFRVCTIAKSNITPTERRLKRDKDHKETHRVFDETLNLVTYPLSR